MAVAELLAADRGASAMETLLITLGAVVLLYAPWRYRRVAGLLDEGRFASARWGPLLLGIATLMVALAAVLYVLG